MLKKGYFILLLVVVTLISGCVKFPVTSPTFEGKINFEIFEKFTKQFDGPHLYLSVSTGSYGCCNYGFEHSVSTTDNTIKVILGSITKPNICLTAFGPASFSEDLNLNEGTYTLEFQSKDKIDKYSVKVSKDSVTIETIGRTFSRMQKLKIDRLPENLLWADCFYNGNWKYNPKDDYCERFFTEIKTFAQPYLISEEGKTPKNQFYLYTGEDQPLINLIQKYDRESFYVKISTWEGKTFICPGYCEEPGVADVHKVEIEYLEEPKTNVSECNDNVVCIMEVAFNTKNEKICEQLPKENQGQCFCQVGIAKLDESLCEKTDNYEWYPYIANECYSYIAIQKSNPNLCEEVNNSFRDSCYISYAEAKNDISFCDKVVSTRRAQFCLDKFK